MNQSTKNMLLFAGGVALGAALPVVVPALVEGGRPLAKALLKHGTLGFQRVQLLAARAAESLEDLVAEVRAEAEPAAAQAADAVHEAAAAASDLADKKVLS